MSALYVSIFTAFRKKHLICLDSACSKNTLEKDMLFDIEFCYNKTLNFVIAHVPVKNVSAASSVAPRTL